MAEINARDQKQTDDAPADPPAPAPDASDADGSDEQLSDDQQAALDKIMAEINARDQKQTDDAPADPPAPAPDASDADGSDEQLSDDQQAALDKIMAEINARDNKADSEPVSEQAATVAIDKDAPAQETRAEGATLSFDEFNDELDSLLSKAQIDNRDAPPPATPSKKNKSETENKEASQTPVSGMSSLKYGPAPQSAAPSPTDTDGDPKESSADTTPEQEEKPRPTYAVLQEIDPDRSGKAGSSSRKRKEKPQRAGKDRLLKVASAVSVLLAAVSLIFWGLGRWNHRTFRNPAPAVQPPAAPSPAVASAISSGTDSPTPPAKPSEPAEDAPGLPRQPDETSLASLESDLSSAREQVLGKIKEIMNLIAYYEDGIQDEHQKIRNVLLNNPVPPLEQALSDSQIELSVRAIQRRRAYISKLGPPLEQLKASSEELLFLERRTRLFEALSQWIGGPSMPEYRRKIADRIQLHIKTIKELSADNSQTAPPSKASVWQDVLAGLEKEKALEAQRSALNSRDKSIGQEICNGKFDRKYQLTRLSEAVATCIIQWSGKDLYLNGLTELTPQAARILAQWPGEWLSLNGIKELPAETARYLAQWPGKRLSLNGLERLSPQATAELSKWQGEQLEMVGLTSIGPWENYATRLYLSETMKRKLQM
jgi:hypothetical protein